MSEFEQPTSTEKRTLVTFVLDRSGSMEGAPINSLNQAMNQFIDDMRNDPNFCQHIEVAVVSFDHRVVEDLSPTLADDIDRSTYIELKAEGLTHMVEAMNYAIDLVHNRKQYYKNQNLTYTRSYIVLVTDGEPNDPDVVHSLPLLAQRIEQDTKDSRYILVCLAVDGANVDVLDFIAGYVGNAYGAEDSATHTYKRMTTLKLKEAKFKQFFEFVAASSKQVSSTKGTGTSDGITADSFPDWLTN